MVRGIEEFRDHFRTFDNAFVVIGGTASLLLLDEAGLDFRATKDIDVVLFVEAMSADFAEAFWAFVEEGGYRHVRQATGQQVFYRFDKPTNSAFPAMVELFSRHPEMLDRRPGSRLTRILVADGETSLSAILMADDYYALTKNGRKVVDGVPVLGAEWLIPLKAKAWLDLSTRQRNGEKISSTDIRKHRNDVFRLYQLLSPETRVELSPEVAGDLTAFLDAAEASGIDIAQLGVRGLSLADAVHGLRQIYGL